MLVDRRDFLERAAVAVASSTLLGCRSWGFKPQGELDIIDCHTHFYDPRRPEGIAWPGEGSSLYRTVLPKDLCAQPSPRPVTGTVIVEASPRLEDNQWLLDIAKNDPFVVGIVGHLKPGGEGYAEHVERFAKNPLFRGIRNGQATVDNALKDAAIVDAIRLLGEHDLAYDVNGSITMPLAVARLAEKLPEQRIVINHIGNVTIEGQKLNEGWLAGMRAAAMHPNVYCKVSALVEGAARATQPVPRNIDHYKPTLDAVWEAFGEDHLIYGSNWPVSETAADYATVLQIVLDYVEPLGRNATEKFFSLNAKRAYRWVEREGRVV